MELSLVSHFYNEELLIGDWIDYHKKFFDYAVLIDHHSTDASPEIAQSKLPDGWRIVTSRLSEFDAELTDREVMEYEKTLPGWKMALCTTEYLFYPDIRIKLKILEQKYPRALAFGSRAIYLVDKIPGLPLETPIWKNRNWGFLFAREIKSPIVIHFWRYIHKAEHGHYMPGRHLTCLPHQAIPDFFHLRLHFSPWPQAERRKLQIQYKIPDKDKLLWYGSQHIVTQAALEERYLEYSKFSSDLFAIPEYVSYYRELLKR